MKYSITVTLYEEIEAESEDAAFDQMLDMIRGRDGMDVVSHKIEEIEDGSS